MFDALLYCSSPSCILLVENEKARTIYKWRKVENHRSTQMLLIESYVLICHTYDFDRVNAKDRSENVFIVVIMCNMSRDVCGIMVQHQKQELYR